LQQSSKGSGRAAALEVCVDFVMALVFGNTDIWDESPPAINAPIRMDVHTALSNHAIQKAGLYSRGCVYGIVRSALQVESKRLFAF
jgi:hypothetical protein